MSQKLLKDCTFKNKLKILTYIDPNYSLEEISHFTQGEFMRNFSINRKSLKIIRELLVENGLDFKGPRTFV